MGLGDIVLLWFTDGTRKCRPAAVSELLANGNITLYVFAAPADNVSPANCADVPMSGSVFSDDPALEASGLPCWSPR